MNLANRFHVHYTKRRARLIHKIRELTRVQAPMERTRLFAEIPNQTLLIVVERSRPRLRRNEGESRLSNSLRYKFWFDDPESNQGDQEVDDQGCFRGWAAPICFVQRAGPLAWQASGKWKDVMR